jgi:nucleoside-diphosphate-sugar epimerase
LAHLTDGDRPGRHGTSSARQGQPAPPGDWRDVSVLITGGLGFIGSNLAAHLLTAGAFVVVADKEIDGPGRRFLEESGAGVGRLEIVYLDVRDRKSVAGLVRRRDFTAVFHLAAYSVIERAFLEPVEAMETNATGTLNVLDSLRESGSEARFVLASSDKIYGEMEGNSYVETSPARALGIYEVGKLAADAMSLSYSRAFGVKAAVLRLCNVIGPGDHNIGYRIFPKSLWGIFVGVRPGAPVLYRGSVHHWRDYVYVGDAVRALAALATHPAAVGEAFNVPPAAHLSTPDVLEKIVSAAVNELKAVDPDRAEAVLHNGVQVSDESADAVVISRQHLDAEKIFEYLQFRLEFSLDYAVQQTAKYYLKLHYH